jgi:hypothetical protein
MVRLYLHSLIRVRGVVLNTLSTGTTLPFTLYIKYLPLSSFIHVFLTYFISIPLPLFISFRTFPRFLSFFLIRLRKQFLSTRKYWFGALVFLDRPCLQQIYTAQTFLSEPSPFFSQSTSHLVFFMLKLLRMFPSSHSRFFTSTSKIQQYISLPVNTVLLK